MWGERLAETPAQGSTTEEVAVGCEDVLEVTRERHRFSPFAFFFGLFQSVAAKMREERDARFFRAAEEGAAWVTARYLLRNWARLCDRTQKDVDSSTRGYLAEARKFSISFIDGKYPMFQNIIMLVLSGTTQLDSGLGLPSEKCIE